MAVQNKNSTRLAIFIALLLVAISVHLIVIRIIVPKEEKQPEETVQPAPAAVQETAPTAAPAPAAPGSSSNAAPAPAAAAAAAKPAVKQKLFRAPAGIEVGKPFLYKQRVNRLPASVTYAGSVRTGFMVDLNSRRVLWEKDSEKPVPVASMVKMMTILLTLEAVDASPDLSLETVVPVPRLKYPNSGVAWLDPRESFPLEALLRVMVVKSANDAAMVVAHRIGGGSIPVFVNKMNARAASLKMTRTNFNSPCGLPDQRRVNSLSSARDMVVLGEQLLNYPVVREWCLLKTTSIREGNKKVTFRNTNNLIVPHYPGVDGLKTGYTRDAGFCLTFTAERNGRRLLGCVTGFKTPKERDVFSRRLIDWGFVQAETLAKANGGK